MFFLHLSSVLSIWYYSVFSSVSTSSSGFKFVVFMMLKKINLKLSMLDLTLLKKY